MVYDFIRRKPVDVYVFDRERGTSNLLTSQGDNILPAWSHDGRRVIFSSFKRGASSFDLYWTPEDGSGQPEPLLIRDNGQIEAAASPDGQLIAFTEHNPQTGVDIYFLHLDDGKSVTAVQTTSANEESPSFSPDGRFLAYASDKTGRFEVYVCPVSGSDSIKMVSTYGGVAPKWSPKGDELFYRSGDKMMSVQVSTRSEFSAGTPREIFKGTYGGRFDVAPDGQHFLMIKHSTQPLVTQIQFILNWFEELKEKVSVP